MSEALLQELMDINKAMKEELSKQNIILSSQKRYSQDEFDEAYQRGLNDAWEAARKITLNTNQGGVPTKELAMIFGEFNSCSEIMVRSTASEAVAKLKEYEQKQADKIEVGDEVAFRNDNRRDTVVVVTYIGDDGYIDGMDGRGTQYAHKNPKKWTKTGRHFPEIAAALEKMREEQE